MLKDVNFKKIHDNQLERMKAYIESIDNTPYKICMIKNAVWPLDSKTKPPCNSIISKILKKKLKLLYKIFQKWNYTLKSQKIQQILNKKRTNQLN